MNHIAKRKIGVNFKDNQAEIYVWSPSADEVKLVIENGKEVLEMTKKPFGYWHLQTPLLTVGMDYQFELNTGEETLIRADPASLSQPNGVHGASRAIDLSSFRSNNSSWKGLPLKEYIIYELHIGTFSAEGTFDGAIDKLDHLVELGVTAVELMPLASFPGERNWGYDGVFPFAVQHNYGGAEGLKKLVDACHAKGLAVVLDVVYNHVGPEGNYLADFGPYFTEKYHTPWGQAVNFDDAYAHGVRDFFIENAIMWMRDFHVDALRLDAVHAIKDFSATHLLSAIKGKVEELIASTGRQHHLIVECDLNDPKYITPLSQNGLGMDAQWIDEFHHALRVAAGQPKDGYYADFNGLEHLAKSYADAYIYDGEYSQERKRFFGKPATDRAGEQFVVFSQNHDQVGNRMLGERSGQLYSREMQKLLAGAVLVSPYLPLLFMGEEWGETNPFLYFVNHTEPELIEAVRKGRNEEFKAFHQGDAPDPQSVDTFNKSKLQWDLLSNDQHHQLFLFYKELIALRKSNPVLKMLNRDFLKTEVLESQQCLLIHRWQNEDRLLCLLNFSKEPQEINFPDHTHWSLILDSSSSKYGGKSASHLKTYTDDILVVQPESILIYSQKHA